MFRVYNCLTVEHDLRLVALAVSYIVSWPAPSP